jgi:hypothetical protein
MKYRHKDRAGQKEQRFRRIYEKHVVRRNRLEQLRAVIRHSWDLACKFDGIDPDSGIVDFSQGNPYRISYDAAVSDLQRELNRN